MNKPSNPVPVTVEGALSGRVSFRDVDEPGRAPYSAQFDPDKSTNGCFAAGGGFQYCEFPGGFLQCRAASDSC